MESCGEGRELPLSPLKRCVLLSVIKYFPLLLWNVCFDPRVISELVFMGSVRGGVRLLECCGSLWEPSLPVRVLGSKESLSIFTTHGSCLLPERCQLVAVINFPYIKVKAGFTFAEVHKLDHN